MYNCNLIIQDAEAGGLWQISGIDADCVDGGGAGGADAADAGGSGGDSKSRNSHNLYLRLSVTLKAEYETRVWG